MAVTARLRRRTLLAMHSRATVSIKVSSGFLLTLVGGIVYTTTSVNAPRDIRRLPRSSRGCPWLGSPATSSSDGLPLRPRAAPRRAHGPLLPHDGLDRGRRRRRPGDHGARLARARWLRGARFAAHLAHPHRDPRVPRR